MLLALACLTLAILPPWRRCSPRQLSGHDFCLLLLIFTSDFLLVASETSLLQLVMKNFPKGKKKSRASLCMWV